MPLLVHPVLGPLAVHRETVQLPRQSDREVSDVHALLNLADALGLDLAHLEGDEFAERLDVLAEGVAHATHEFAALRGGQHAPGLLDGHCPGDGRVVVVGRLQRHRSERLSVRRVQADRGLARRIGGEDLGVVRETEAVEDPGEGRMQSGGAHGAKGTSEGGGSKRAGPRR